MSKRHALPRLWLMTDERQEERLWRALERLPRGAGVVFRHYCVAGPERRTLFDKMKQVVRRRGLVLVTAQTTMQRLGGADGRHFPLQAPAKARARSHARRMRRPMGPRRRSTAEWLMTASAHDRRELVAAERSGADLVFLSPLYPTRSHPGARILGRVRFARLARSTRLPVIALGGMDLARARGLAQLGAYGWAGIDAWSGASG